MELNKAETRNSALKGEFQVDDPLKAASELAHILLNLRHHTTLFDTHFGYANRVNKKHWEQKADRWLTAHRLA
jgi:hypothetical protein